MDIFLQPVTGQDEIERLVEINHDAMLKDPLFNWMELYTENSEDEGTRTALMASLEDSSYHIIKAVIGDPAAPQSQQVVGFIQYFQGLIELPRISDSKGDFQKAQNPQAAPKEHDEAQAARLRIGDQIYIHTRNFYISTINGQKHQCEPTRTLCHQPSLLRVLVIRRLMVHPRFQRRGIANKLLLAVASEADQMRTPMWLFSRPAGEPLYERAGFIEVGQTRLDVPEFKVGKNWSSSEQC